MPFRKKSCLSIFIILSIFPFFTAFAQNKLSYISGMVYDKDSGDPLQDAIVLIRGMKEEYGTDKDGKFKIRLYPGNHRFVISFIGYEEMDTLVNTGNRSFLKFGLKHNNELKGIVITSGRKTENITRPYMGVQNLSGPEIKEIPALMGEVDVIKAIQLLPGVQSTSEGSSGFTVR
ncbi:MAG: carboxypeptidase-like regulatory domain-containing protein, partial [Bacteroidales bacterium]|nr:carboxypeptidase-like regulatory domain-containing protein [Bacteroidales bacterium]